MNKPTMW